MRSLRSTFFACQRLFHVICPERERLQQAYMEAAAKIAEAGSQILDMTSAKWKDATSAHGQPRKQLSQRCTFIAKNTAANVLMKTV